MRKFKKGDRVMVEKRDSWPASPGTVEGEKRMEYANHYHIDVMRDDGITNKMSLGSSMICDIDWLTLLPEFKLGDEVECTEHGTKFVIKGMFEPISLNESIYYDNDSGEFGRGGSPCKKLHTIGERGWEGVPASMLRHVEKMYDFKVGDRVECIGRMCMARGDFGKIVGAREDSKKRWFVKWDRESFPDHPYLFSDLKLVKSKNNSGRGAHLEKVYIDEVALWEQKEKNSMNPIISKMYGKNTADEANLVQKHFGKDFDNLTPLQALSIEKDKGIILAKAKSLEAEAKKKENQNLDPSEPEEDE